VGRVLWCRKTSFVCARARVRVCFASAASSSLRLHTNPPAPRPPPLPPLQLRVPRGHHPAGLRRLPVPSTRRRGRPRHRGEAPRRRRRRRLGAPPPEGVRAASARIARERRLRDWLLLLARARRAPAVRVGGFAGAGGGGVPRLQRLPQAAALPPARGEIAEGVPAGTNRIHPTNRILLPTVFF
jgi:hypothetical protein